MVGDHLALADGPRLNRGPFFIGSRSLGLPTQTGGVNTVVSAEGVFRRDDDVRGVGLHPLGDGDPDFIWADLANGKVPQARAALWHEHSLCGAQDREGFGIHLSDEERGAVAEDVIIVRPLAGVNEPEGITMRDPVLLGVVVAEAGAVIEAPRLELAKVQAILTDGDEPGRVIPQGEVKAPLETGQGGLINTAPFLQDELTPLLDEPHHLPIKAATQNGDAVVFVFLPFEVDGQEDVTVVQIHALHATGTGAVKLGVLRHFERGPGTPLAGGFVINGVAGLAFAVMNHFVAEITYGVPGAEEFAGLGVPFRGEVAGADDDTPGLLTATQGLRMRGDRAPVLPQVIGAGVVELKEDIATVEQEFLQGHDHLGPWAWDGSRARMDPAGLAIVTFGDGLQSDLKRQVRWRRWLKLQRRLQGRHLLVDPLGDEARHHAGAFMGEVGFVFGVGGIELAELFTALGEKQGASTVEINDRNGFFFANHARGLGVRFECVDEETVGSERAACDGGDEYRLGSDGAGLVDEAAEFITESRGRIRLALWTFAGLVIVTELDEDVIGLGSENFGPVATGAEGAGGGTTFGKVGDLDGGFEEVGQSDAPAGLGRVGGMLGNGGVTSKSDVKACCGDREQRNCGE